ncbi:MAG: adenosylmethionine decarboxylase [Pelagibacterales bacterium]|nr:adenosylmethionine decarboxylase [Pelagibacterales bacterium]
MIKEKAISQKNILHERNISKDHFIIENKQEFAGYHILLDLWNIKFDNSIKTLRKIICEAIKISGATLLHIHLHRFGKEKGISGVAVLAESHISVHTWPERDYIAFDIFMCGDTHPQLAAEYLIKTFKPQKEILKSIKRGVTKIVK